MSQDKLLGTLGDSALKCNESYWNHKYTQALREANIAALELSKLYDIKAKRDKKELNDIEP